MFKDIIFNNPEFFWLLLLIPLSILWYVFNQKKENPSVTCSSVKGFKFKASTLPKFRHILFALRMLALALLVVALARPQNRDESTRTKTTDGIDIVMAIDVSSSMLAKDFKPNRLEALRKVASQFVEDRPSDRIGLVVYSGESYTKTPVTSDKHIILNSLREITYGQTEDGTAIGMGLATAVNRLKESKAKSKVIILLTDGVNNSGFIEPQMASEMAKEFGIKVYTIGIGSNGTALSPVAYNPDGSLVYRNVPVKIDEKLMKDIAKITGGKYFRATDNKKLEQIYDEINQMETSKVEEFKYFNVDERFRIFAIVAGLLLVLEQLLRYTIFRSFL